MRVKLFIIILLLIGGLWMMTGCSNEPDVISGDPEQPEIVDPDRIKLSSGGLILSTDPLSRASSTTFPNNGEIGIIAAEYKRDAEISWTDYTDIQDELAIAGNPENGLFGFTWSQEIKLWPFDNTELIFAAYSPQAATTSCMTLNSDNTALELTFQKNMPDILYSPENGIRNSYRRTANTTVELGEFEHALCQLKIVVEAHDEMNKETIRLEAMKIVTNIEKATLNLFPNTENEEDFSDGEENQNEDEDNTDNIITLGPANSEIEITLLENEAIDFSKKPYTIEDVLVFPYTQDNMDLWLTLDDGGFDINHKINMSMFDVIFERGKSVILTIIVKSQTVTGPEPGGESIELFGKLTPWKEKGNSSVIIQ